jgi:hypothetical protein
MRKLAAVMLVALACKGNDSKAVTSAKPAPAPAADPWSEKPKADIKDPKLARLVELAQNGPGKDKYPQADAVVALENDAITYKPDGSVVHKHHSIVKLIDPQRGKEKFADVRIAFDSERETLTIDTARTVNADGEPHVASNEEIGDIVPPYLADATIYSGVRERVISFPAVDVGSVIELEYTRTTRSTPDSPRGGVEMLARWNPVIERIVSITAPTKITPQMFTTAGLESKPKQTASADSRTWTWRFADLPDRHPEYGAPTEEAVLPRLVYGFVNAWPDVLEPVAGRFLASGHTLLVLEQEFEGDHSAHRVPEDRRRLDSFLVHHCKDIPGHGRHGVGAGGVGLLAPAVATEVRNEQRVPAGKTFGPAGGNPV